METENLRIAIAGTGMVGVAVTRANRDAIAVLQDLSPAATHIASEILSEINYTIPVCS